MGVRNKMIRETRAANGMEPESIEEEHRFTVRLLKPSPGSPPAQSVEA